ncbi:MAG: hypothetical protein ACRCX7_11140 [Cetobacterium sp.]|uniref:hypothetical protein n=1 Tax=Cetobacterium sp. TaxID=2071632 RepID=UPI003F342747
MNKKYYYISLNRVKESMAVLNYGVFSEPIDGAHPFPDAYLYISDTLPGSLIWDETTNKCRTLTDFEMVKYGKRPMYHGEFIFEDKILHISNFPIPDNIVKPVFNNKTLEWHDSANSEEKAVFWREKCKLISSEMIVLERAGLDGDSEYIKLQVRLEDFKEKHITSIHEIALDVNKAF